MQKKNKRISKLFRLFLIVVLALLGMVSHACKKGGGGNGINQNPPGNPPSQQMIWGASKWGDDKWSERK